jgi:photosystem II stability/assembly factor-like uncharacterized protein
MSGRCFLFTLAAVQLAAQTISIQEINPTQSTLGGNGASGGRVNGLAKATETTFYAASEFGGLYKSTDTGHTWVRLDNHIPTVTIDVEANPANPNRVIATSKYDGRVTSLAGINISDDAGATWRKPASATPPAGLCVAARSTEPSAFGISFDHDNPANVYAGTNCGLAISNDSGTTWRFVDPTPATTATDVRDVFVHHGGIIDTCGSDGHRRSVDGGATWTTAAAGGTPLPGGQCSITASPDEPYVLIAVVGTAIFETDNAGGTWNTQLTNPRAQGRVPFVATNKRAGRSFDLWFGDVNVFRAACTTPVSPAPGGAARCPTNTWTAAGQGAHADMGDIQFTTPPTVNVKTCQAACVATQTDCNDECVAIRDDCMAEVGRPGGFTAAQCVQQFSQCRNGCTARFKTCTAQCSNRPEACPVMLSSDGGVFFNTSTVAPACNTPLWQQPNVTPRSLWLWSVGGGDIPQSSTAEAVYMGAQDNGTFATTNGGAAAPTWFNRDCCDAFDTVADSTQVVYTVCCFTPAPATRVFVRGQGMTGGAEIATNPAGVIPGFGFPDVIARFGSGRYALVTSAGIFITQNIAANPVVWTALGANAPVNACAIYASRTGASPVFYAQTGRCDGNGPGQLMRFNGTTASGTWQNVAVNNGVGIFAVDPANSNRLFASSFDAAGVRMVRSNDGGATLANIPALDTLMRGNGVFRMTTSTYVQPTLVAFDPGDVNTLLAGAADAGVFLSRDNGVTWTTVTTNAGPPANPIVPRPHWAYFDRECSRCNMYVGTQGRGLWRVSYPDPNGITVTACQAACDKALPDCQTECAAIRDECMAQVGRPGGSTAAQCAMGFQQCRTQCNTARNTCRQRCVDCPQ